MSVNIKEIADVKDRRPHPNNAPYFPERPKGMHGETFANLLAEVEDAREEWHNKMEARQEPVQEK